MYLSMRGREMDEYLFLVIVVLSLIRPCFGCGGGGCPPSPVHGSWGSWSTYIEPDSCNCNGMSYRERHCNNPSPEHGGHNCDGQTRQVERFDCNECACNNGDCDHYCNNRYDSIPSCSCRPGYTPSGSSCTAIPCATSNWKTPSNGRKTTDNCKDGKDVPLHTTCEVQCKEGYRLKGSSSSKCTLYGIWNPSTPPTCEEITCSSIVRTSRLQITPAICTSNPPSGMTCTVSCKDGFSLTKYSSEYHTTTCNKGTWTAGSSFSCRDLQKPDISGCPSESIVTIAAKMKIKATVSWGAIKATDNDGSVPSMTVYPHYLNPGTTSYEFSEGTHGIVYTARDLTWNQRTCRFDVIVKVIRCASISPPKNGRTIPHVCSSLLGSKCNYECNDGYNLTSSTAQRECIRVGDSGNWIGNEPTCQQITCQPLFRPLHGRMTGVGCYDPNPAYKTLCSFKCLTGYQVIAGSDTRLCKLDGLWTGSDLQCQIITCPALPQSSEGLSISNAACIQNISQYNDKCSYTCASGYLLLGTATKTCSATGQWTPGGNPYCKDISAPSFGVTCPSDIKVLADRHSRSVRVNWTDPLATDNAPNIPGIVRHGRKPGDEFNAGHYSIKYIATDRAGNTAQCLFQVIVEVVKCPFLKAPSRGSVRCSLDNVYGSQCSLSCNIGHALKGSIVRTCEKYGNQLNGRWTGNDTYCKAVTCPPLYVTSHSYKAGCLTNSFGEKCLLYCNVGYKAVSGSSYRVCRENGSWSGSEIVCKAVNCSALVPQSAGISITPSICSRTPLYQVTCQYFCPPGYRMNGLGIKTCLASGKWNHYGNVSCLDIERPRFTSQCPSNIDEFAPMNKNVAVVQVPPMTATDNSGEIPAVTITGQKHNYSAGRHEIVISATDKTGNQQICRFFINIKILRCVQHPDYIINGKTVGKCENSWGSTCHFECNAGYNMTGSSSRTCKVIPGQIQGYWSGTMPFCTINRCRPLKAPSDGYVYPPMCVAKQAPVSDTSCLFGCYNGFSQSSGISTITCGKDTNWSENTSLIITCKDKTPPRFKNSCPMDIRVLLGRNGLAIANWTVPIAEDNTNVPPVITVQPSGAKPPFTVNQSTTVAYTAEDASGNAARCSFRILVEDNLGPSVLYCPPNVSKVAMQLSEKVTWNEPKFVDNSNIKVTAVCNRKSGQSFYWGVWNVHCRGYDSNPNNAPALCSFTVTVSPKPCPTLNVPKNGAKSCANWMLGLFCTPMCNDKFDFEQPIAFGAMWACGSTGTWLPTSQLPDCSATYAPGTARKAGKLYYFSGNCHNKTVQLQMKKQFIQIVISSIFKEICTDAQLQHRCNVSNVGIECGMANDMSQNDPDFSDPAKRKRRSIDPQFVIKVSFDMTVSPGNSSKQQSKKDIKTEVEDAEIALDKIAAEIRHMADNGSLELNATGQPITPINGSFSASKTKFSCSAGQIFKDNKCIGCPVGTYHNTTQEKCVRCPKGWYQDTEEQQACVRCQPGTSTIKEQSKNSSDCMVYCRPGYSSPTGFEPCIPCNKGKFQPLPGQIKCIPCSANMTTEKPGSKSSWKCSAPCSPGSFSPTGLQPCTKCDKRSFQPRSEEKYCFNCPGTTVTINEGSRNSSACIEINECLSSPCRSGSTCIDLVGDYMCHCRAGFTGKQCEKDIDDCASTPCQNNGTCQDSVNSFSCNCSKGFKGETCETEINECEKVPCLNNATCHDLIGRYQCFCPVGYEGTRCEKERDECEPDPCLNGGTCTDKFNAFQCQCLKGFRGPTCQENIDDCNPNPCDNSGQCNDGVHTFTCTCRDGFTGSNCESDINECVSNPCQNNATCFNEVGDFSCVCQKGFNGTLCKQEVNECLSDPCQHGGTCKDRVGSFSCNCTSGFQGDNCEKDVDECTTQPCTNGAMCINTVGSYSCKCLPGFTGKACDVDIDECLSNPCKNNGSCENLQNEYICHCADGYSGPQCQVDIDECAASPCKNNATCLDKVNDYTCNCKTGFTGDVCDVKIDYCAENPCQNSGLCRNIEGDFRCTCAKGYTGKNCSHDINECENNPCSINGHCEDLVGSYRCLCFPGFTGINCTQNIDDCVASGCSGNSTCLDGNSTYQCLCNEGFTGKYCEVQISPCDWFPCLSGGVCREMNYKNYTCSCSEGFTGSECQVNIDDCKPTNPCQNNGSCTDLVANYTCTCPKGYFGGDCEYVTDFCSSSNCSSHGACINLPTGFICNCTEGFYGPTCDLPVQNCFSSPCKNGGTCHEDTGGFNCTCRKGFMGDLCEADVDDCKEHRCLNNATCVDKVDDYLCICHDGFNGTVCEHQLRSCKDNPCTNNGTCEDIFGGYRCKCSERYGGAACNIDKSPCVLNPCLNGGVCTELNLTNFKCTCKSGFSGDTCQTNIDDCLSAPCPMNSNCIDGLNSYTCQCIPSYTGKECEIRLGSNFDLIFQDQSTDTVVELPASSAVPDLMRLSVALWVKPDVRFKQGTILIYQTHGINSEMMEISFNNSHLRFVVQNDVLDSVVNITDGKWHFIGLSWSRFDKDFSIYYDGKQIGATKIPNQFDGPPLKGGGEVILGRKYSPKTMRYTDAFVGVLHQVNIWHIPVPTGESYMWNAAHSCSWPLEGNVYPWLAFLSGAKRGVLKKFPSSCKALDLCKENCSHYVTCHKDDIKMVCTCKKGFTGKLCDVNINDCVSNPCLHGGKCVDDIAFYRCECIKGYYGTDCEHKQIEINKVCHAFKKLPYGQVKKESYAGKHFAKLMCDEEYSFRKGAVTSYACGPQTNWKWIGHNNAALATLPRCLRMSEPVESKQVYSILLPVDTNSCQTSEGYEQIKKSFEAAFFKSIENTEQHGCFLYGFCKISKFSIPKCNSRRQSRSAEGLTVNFELLFREWGNSSSVNTVTETAEAVVFHVKYAVTVGSFVLKIDGKSVKPSMTSLALVSKSYSCKEGYVGSSDDTKCVACPAGTYQSIFDCVPCPKGQYQDTQGSSQCSPCPKGYSTVAGGATQKEQCATKSVTEDFPAWKIILIGVICAAVVVATATISICCWKRRQQNKKVKRTESTSTFEQRQASEPFYDNPNRGSHVYEEINIWTHHPLSNKNGAGTNRGLSKEGLEYVCMDSKESLNIQGKEDNTSSDFKNNTYINTAHVSKNSIREESSTA